MSAFAHWFSLVTGYTCLPAMAALALVFYWKNNNRNILVFSAGLVVMVIGQFTMLFFPYASLTFDAVERIISESGPPLGWYLGNLLFSLGLITAVAGLGLMTFRTRSIEIKSR